jgi:para-nitrobenzyl esterase
MPIAIGRRTAMLTTGASLVAPAGASAQTAATVVETTGGKLRGVAANGITCFKGVPYAASTAGSNRFLPPTAAASWPGVRDATAFGSSAPQLPASADPLGAWYGALQPISEDCLSLNVWTAGTTGKRPVMVWLHGGAWVSCAGSAPGFDGTVLAHDGEVVVVTINHRLNLFGYIRLDDPDDRFAQSGNAGVLDMVAALRWIRDNAAAFGGDPGNVRSSASRAVAPRSARCLPARRHAACSTGQLLRAARAACVLLRRRRPPHRRTPWRGSSRSAGRPGPRCRPCRRKR